MIGQQNRWSRKAASVAGEASTAAALAAGHLQAAAPDVTTCSSKAVSNKVHAAGVSTVTSWFCN